MCIISLTALGVSAIATAIASSASTAAATAGALGATAAMTAAMSTATTAATVASVAGTVATVSGVVEGVGLAIAGGVMGTVGAIQEAEEQKAMAEFQAEQAAENSRLSFREAEAIGVQGRQEQKELRLQMLSQKSSARAGFAASGVVLGGGSTTDFEADIADAYDSDARNLEYDIASRQWVKRVEGTNHADQAAFYRAQAKAADRSKTTSLLSGIFNTGQSALSTGLSTAKSMDGLMSKIGTLKKAGA